MNATKTKEPSMRTYIKINHNYGELNWGLFPGLIPDGVRGDIRDVELFHYHRLGPSQNGEPSPSGDGTLVETTGLTTPQILAGMRRLGW